MREIAALMGRSPSTVRRELARGADASGRYRPSEAHRRALGRRRLHRPGRLSRDAGLRDRAADRLRARWSPEQIARRLPGEILDVFSRCVPGWLVATRESAALAERLIAETIAREGIARDTMKLHADRGAAMRSKEVSQLLADLGVGRSHSRPHVSDDNPYSEAQFKTLKYRHGFPERFGSLGDARAFLGPFFAWHDTEHRHSGIGLLTPETVYRGRGEEVRAQRQLVLDTARAAHPERFVRKRPESPRLPEKVWINPPKEAPAGQ